MQLNRVCLLFAVFIALPMLAADGRIPIASTGYFIGTPGHYYMTKNLSASTSGSVIYIQANDVDLDLNGFTVENTSTSGSVINVTTNTRIRIRNGKVNGGAYGVFLTTGGVADSAVEVDDLIVTGFSSMGVTVGTAAGVGKLTAVIRNNVIGTNLAGCFAAISTGNGLMSRIENNTISGCKDSTLANGYGIYLTNSVGALVKNNLLRGTDRGIVLSSNSSNNVVDDNSITGTAATRPGIAIFVTSNQNIYSRNRLTGNAVAGVTDTGTGNISGGGNCFNASNLCF